MSFHASSTKGCPAQAAEKLRVAPLCGTIRNGLVVPVPSDRCPGGTSERCGVTSSGTRPASEQRARSPFPQSLATRLGTKGGHRKKLDRLLGPRRFSEKSTESAGPLAEATCFSQPPAGVPVRVSTTACPIHPPAEPPPQVPQPAREPPPGPALQVPVPQEQRGPVQPPRLVPPGVLPRPRRWFPPLPPPRPTLPR